jgi:hypothetical protein
MVGTLVGTVGVSLLLIAFFLNLQRRLADDSPTYLWLNIVGSAMAAGYAVVTSSIPFVVLESAWAVAALHRLLTGKRKAPR